MKDLLIDFIIYTIYCIGWLKIILVTIGE